MDIRRPAIYTLVVLSILAVQETNARDIPKAPESRTIKSPANLTLEELKYILETRNGIVAKKPKQLTPCARAILSCCKEKVINEQCSESLHCGAYFFDDNPCDNRFLTDALKNARYFYEQFGQSKSN